MTLNLTKYCLNNISAYAVEPFFAPEALPFKRGVLLSGVEINILMLRFTSSNGFSREVGFSGWSLKRGSII